MSWLSTEVSDRCPGRYTRAQNWRNRAKQSQFHDRGIQFRREGCIGHCSAVAVSSDEKHQTSSISFRIHIHRAISTEQLSTEHWAFVSCTEPSKSHVVTTLSNRPLLVETFRQAVSDIVDSRARSTQGTPFQAVNYRHLLYAYSPVTPQDFDNKRQGFQARKEKI